jgi:ribosomal protein L40E
MGLPAIAASAFLNQRGGEGHGGLQRAQVNGQGRAIQLTQAFQSQPAIRANDDLDRVALPQAGLEQAIGRQPQGQAVEAATNRLLKMLVCSRGSALGADGAKRFRRGRYTTLRAVDVFPFWCDSRSGLWGWVPDTKLNVAGSYPVTPF